MAKLKSKARLKRVFNELIFLRGTYEDSLELFKEYNEEFERALSDTTELIENPLKSTSAVDERNKTVDDIDRETPEPQPAEPASEPDEDIDVLEGPEAPAWMKKLFKNIARETHPDAIHNRQDLQEPQKEERENIYKKSLSALESLNELHLLEAGLKLDVDIPLEPHKQQEILSFEVNKIKKKLTDFDALVCWLWGENEGNIDIRVELLLYARDALGLPGVPKEILEKYVLALEAGEDLYKFKEQHSDPGKTKKPSSKAKRKTGERPGPSVASLRRNK